MAKKRKSITEVKPKLVKLKSKHAKSILYHHKKGVMNLASLSQEELLELYNEEIYRGHFQ